jgi:hypothetical protein
MCLVGFRKVSNWNEIMIIHIVEGTVGWLAGVGLSRLWVAEEQASHIGFILEEGEGTAWP